jgi:hypothetical protein
MASNGKRGQSLSWAAGAAEEQVVSLMLRAKCHGLDEKRQRSEKLLPQQGIKTRFSSKPINHFID